MIGHAAAFDPIAMLETLNRNEVHYVVVGGLAAGVQGAMWATFDLDVVYERSALNYSALAAALAELQAEPLDPPPGVSVTVDKRALASGDVWTLNTRAGRLDLLGEPTPGLSYLALIDRARWIDGAVRYPVASVDDLIAMKSYAGRPKDVGQAELLRALRDEIDAQR